MEIHERPSGVEGVTLLALDGGLDHTNTDAFIQAMYRALDGGASCVVLDLSRLSYISSWGLGSLVRVHHHFAAKEGRIAFANLHSTVATILRISRLDRLFDLYPTVQAALAAAAKWPKRKAAPDA
jgi:anti-sigma B factor antagonist